MIVCFCVLDYRVVVVLLFVCLLVVVAAFCVLCKLYCCYGLSDWFGLLLLFVFLFRCCCCVMCCLSLLLVVVLLLRLFICLSGCVCNRLLLFDRFILSWCL